VSALPSKGGKNLDLFVGRGGAQVLSTAAEILGPLMMLIHKAAHTDVHHDSERQKSKQHR
jgi:altronate dehydratase